MVQNEKHLGRKLLLNINMATRRQQARAREKKLAAAKAYKEKHPILTKSGKPRKAPTNYKPAFAKLVDVYLAEKDEIAAGVGGVFRVSLPEIDDFAVNWLGATKKSAYEWEKYHPKFAIALDKIRAAQKQKLIEGGLSGAYNATITKLMLSSNHDMREKSDVTTDDQPITPFTDEQTKRIAQRVAGGNNAHGDTPGTKELN